MAPTTADGIARTSCHTNPQRYVHALNDSSTAGIIGMNDKKQNAAILPFRPRDAAAVADESTASVIAVLQDQLQMAREGKLRSVAVVSVSNDGAAIGTQWSSTGPDVCQLIGKLAVLSHDLMAART